MAAFESSSNDTDTSLCANNCGFHGNPNNRNLCSVCYAAFLEKISEDFIRRVSLKSQVKDKEPNLEVRQSPSEDTPLPKTKNRCKICQKKMGMLVFNCRCGGSFCGKHRYPKDHSCNFDHKEMDRKNLAKQIVGCKSDKLDFRV